LAGLIGCLDRAALGHAGHALGVPRGVVSGLSSMAHYMGCVLREE
jgi:hypothetical protein